MTPWCERIAPGRAELGPCCRDDEQRRLRAAFGERPHEVERRRIGPVQVLEGEHNRLGPRARQKPGRHRRQLPSPQFLGREFRRAVRGQRNVDAAARARAQYSAGSRPISRSVFSRSARRCSAGASWPPKRSRPHSAIGCSGVFCRSCEALHSIQVCGVSPSSRVKLLDRVATCRGRARRRSGRTGLRRRGRGPSDGAASQCPPHARRRASEPARRPAGRRRWRERRDRATGAGRRPSTHARPSPRRRRAPPPGAARFP